MASDVTITIQDGGANTAINVPASNVRVKIGCLLTGVGGTAVVNQIISTRSPNTLAAAFVGGQLAEAAALVCLGGGTVLAIGVPIVTPGTATAVTATVPGTSSSAVTVTLDGTNGAWDTYYVRVKCTASGTRGTAGIKFQVSLDAGRNYAPAVNLGTAVTYTIPNTGITLNFGAGTMVLGDYWSFSTVAPMWNDAGISAAITALQNSTYALVGWGGMHAVGVAAGANATLFQSYLGGSPDGTGGLASGDIYTRVLADARDALAPVAWGGSGETEATWMSSIQTDTSAVNAKRVLLSAGFYNMPSAYPILGTTYFYRRPLGWAVDVRESAIPPQRHAGRVKDGSLGNIIISPTTDPTDGFIYHDERLNPGLTGARLCAAKTRVGKQGFFVDQPNLLAPTGSTFTLLPYGNVIDIACDIAFQTAEEEINDDLRSNPNGTLYVTDALAIQNTILAAINTNMTAVGMISGASVIVDQTANVVATGNVPITITIQRNAYVLSVTIFIGFNSPTGPGA